MIMPVDTPVCAYYQDDMTPNEFMAAQKRIGCSAAQLGRWLNLSPVTITRYRRGTTDIPGPVAVAMEALASGWRPIEALLADRERKAG